MIEKHLTKTLENLGLSNKAAKVYLANLMLGESTILELSKKSGVSRTSIYYTLLELKEKGMITEKERGNKNYYMYAEPDAVIKETREKMMAFGEILPDLQQIKMTEKRKPGIEFYFGPAGFKEVWFKIFDSGCSEFCIITAADHFDGYVKEKYIMEEIIAEKRKRNIKSRHIIVDSPKARSIVAKDETENRKSKILSREYSLFFTEIITPNFVVFIFPRLQNLIFTIDYSLFAKTRKNLFEILWAKL